MRRIMSEQMTASSVTYGRTVERNELGQFVPGQPSAYYAARKFVEGTLRKAVHQSPAKLRRACDRLLDIAADDPDPRNAMAAFSLIADRLDGKAVARIETTNGDARSLGMAELLTAILQARASSATDAIEHSEGDTPGGMGDIPVKRDEGGGG